MARFNTVRPIHNVRNGLNLFRNRKTLRHMLRDVFRGQYKMSFLTTAIAIIAIIYIVFPFDVIPDFIPVVGWLDDGLVIFTLLKRLVAETQRYNRHKVMARKVR